jgi:hypothetical protein
MQKGFLFVLTFSAGAAMADSVPRLDLAASSGWNNPAGTYGGSAEFRPIEQLGFSVGAGSAAWGLRLSPQVIYYPFGAESGAYVLGGASLNLGGDEQVTVNDVEVYSIQRDLAISANLAAGWRISVLRQGFVNLMAGYSLGLGDDVFRDKNGKELDGLTEGIYSAATPGGPIVAISAGVAFL